MTLQQLNENWVKKVSKSMEKNGTKGAFTDQCKEMGFRKASYACIDHVEKEYKKAKKKYDDGKMSKKEYDKWLLKRKRANLAKTFKSWNK